MLLDRDGDGDGTQSQAACCPSRYLSCYAAQRLGAKTTCDMGNKICNSWSNGLSQRQHEARFPGNCLSSGGHEPGPSKILSLVSGASSTHCSPPPWSLQSTLSVLDNASRSCSSSAKNNFQDPQTHVRSAAALWKTRWIALLPLFYGALNDPWARSTPRFYWHIIQWSNRTVNPPMTEGQLRRNVVGEHLLSMPHAGCEWCTQK